MNDEFIMPDYIDGTIKYIICPNMSCTGFTDKILQCQNTELKQVLFPDLDLKLCPHLDTAKKVVFCPFGHPIENKVNSSDWQRADCKTEGCHSLTFSRMSDTIYRIPLDRYEEFLKLPYKDNK